MNDDLTPRQKSLLAYGLAALTILVSGVLAGVKVLSGEDWIKLTLSVWAMVTAYHASAPGQAAAKAALPFLLVGLVACSPSGGGSLSVSLLSFGSREAVRAESPRALATSITPITNVSGGASGFAYGGDSYEVACTVSGAVTLYPAVYDATATAWEVYQGYPCALSDAVATEGACIFPARTASGLTWNAFKTGAGTVSACTAAGRSGPVPAGRSTSSGGGGGTVTDVTATAPLSSTGGTTPDISLSGVVDIAHGGTNSGTALSSNRLMCSSGGAIIECSAATNGQLPIGSTGSLPTFGVPTGANGLSWTAGAGTLAVTQTFGTDSSHAAVGSDSRFPPAPSAAGRLLYDSGSAWTALSACGASTLLMGQGASAPICTTTTWPNSLTQGATLVATGANAVGSVVAGTSGYLWTSNGAGVVPSWQAPAGVTATDLFFSPVTYAVSRLTGGEGAGAYTVGTQFVITKTCTISKIRFAWPVAGAETVKVTLWSGAAALATTTVAADAVGVYEGTINYVVGSSDLYKTLYATVYNSGTLNYPTYNPGGGIVTVVNLGLTGGASIIFFALGAYGLGDIQPNVLGGASELFAVEPVLQ